MPRTTAKNYYKNVAMVFDGDVKWYDEGPVLMNEHGYKGVWSVQAKSGYNEKSGAPVMHVFVIRNRHLGMATFETGRDLNFSGRLDLDLDHKAFEMANQLIAITEIRAAAKSLRTGNQPADWQPILKAVAEFEPEFVPSALLPDLSDDMALFKKHAAHSSTFRPPYARVSNALANVLADHAKKSAREVVSSARRITAAFKDVAMDASNDRQIDAQLDSVDVHLRKVNDSLPFLRAAFLDVANAAKVKGALTSVRSVLEALPTGFTDFNDHYGDPVRAQIPALEG